MNEPATLLVLVSGDLMIESRLEGAARAAGARLRALQSPEAARALMSKETPTAALVDLADQTVPAAEVLAELRSRTGEALRVLGFFPHVMPEIGREAERAGYDMVVPRSRFLSNPAALIRALLAPAAPSAEPAQPDRAGGSLT